MMCRILVYYIFACFMISSLAVTGPFLAITAHAQTASSITELSKAIETSASELDAQIAELNQEINTAIKVDKEAEAILDNMAAAVTARLDQLSETSDFSKLTETYISRLDHAKERAYKNMQANPGDPDYEGYWQRYEQLLKDAVGIRKDIFNERKSILSLLDDIEARKDKIIEELRLEQFEKANERLRTTLASLQQMRENMNQLIDRVDKVGRSVPN